MYIVFKYDLFPYRVCKKVVSKKIDGLYEVEGFDGVWFKSIKELNDKRGSILEEALKRLETAKRLEFQQIDKKYEKLVAEQFLIITGL